MTFDEMDAIEAAPREGFIGPMIPLTTRVLRNFMKEKAEREARRAEYEKTPGYKKQHREYLIAKAAADRDKEGWAPDNSHMATSDYDWMRRRGD